MPPEELRLLYHYNSWANHRMLDASSTLSPEQFARELRSSFSSVRDTVVHIMGVEWLWLERWNGRMPTALLCGAEFPDVASIRLRWAEIEHDLGPLP